MTTRKKHIILWNKPERGNDIMSVVNVIVKTIVKFTYGTVQLFGILGEGVSTLSTTINDNLIDFDKKMTKKFEIKK